MDRQQIIENIITKINQLPDGKVKEMDDFINYLTSKIDDKMLLEGIQNITEKSNTFAYLKDEEDLYSVNDLIVKYK